jgi:glycine oxidase
LPNRLSSIADQPKVAIIGAGVIGLGIAWRLAAKGAAVAVFDRGVAGTGASHAAAGMLAACAEAEPGEEALVALGRESQARWPAFAAELLAASGTDVELRQEGTLVVAFTADDQARLNHQLVFQHRLGLPLEWISAAEARRREPHLAGKLAGAVFSPQDHQVDNRKLTSALRTAAQAAGAAINEHRPVAAISSSGGRVDGIVLADDPGLPPTYPGDAAGRLPQGELYRVARHQPAHAGEANARACLDARHGVNDILLLDSTNCAVRPPSYRHHNKWGRFRPFPQDT